MNDEELTRKCWERYSGMTMREDSNSGDIWAPLVDDAQAMALLKRFPLDVFYPRQAHPDTYAVYYKNVHGVYSKDLNRAIVECVARIQ